MDVALRARALFEGRLVIGTAFACAFAAALVALAITGDVFGRYTLRGARGGVARIEAHCNLSREVPRTENARTVCSVAVDVPSWDFFVFRADSEGSAGYWLACDAGGASIRPHFGLCVALWMAASLVVGCFVALARWPRTNATGSS
ncbi:hypothetical protein BH09MYX1_BH09MYX1_13210 [soil metagenome]